MPTYIAKRYDGTTINIVMARTREMANIYWQGKGVTAHHIEERSESLLLDHPTGVMPILETRKESLSVFGGNRHDYIVVSKG